MQFCRVIAIYRSKVKTIVVKQLYFAVCGLLLSATPLFGANPYEATDEEKTLVESIALGIEKLPTFSDRIQAYRKVFDTYGTQADFPLLCELIKSAHFMTRQDSLAKNPTDSFTVLMQSMPFEQLAIRQKAHVKFITSKFQAFADDINTAERGLLEVLNMPREDVHPFTATSAHYMAAYCSYYTNQLQRAANHSRMAAEGFSKMGDQRRALEAYDGASTTFFKIGQIDSALYYARKGLTLADRVDDRYIDNLYLNYAEALMGDRQPDSAFYYALKADELIRIENRPSGIARSQMCLANITSLSGRKKESIPYYKESIKQFKIAREVYHQVDVLDSLVKIHASLGEYRLAYLTSKESFRIRDSLREDRLQKDADRIVAEFERDAFKKELVESERDRALAKAVLKRQQSERLSMAGIICSLLLLVSFVYYRAVTRKQLTRELQAQVNERTAVLRQNSKRLETQAEKLKESNAELERFAYIASHDLKTPLRNVTSFLGLIRRRLPVESRALVREYLDVALVNAHQMNELVTDVLEFSRINISTEAEVGPVKISAVIASIKAQIEEELHKRNAQIHLEGDAELVLPKGSLAKIMGNLISNGLKYNESDAPLVKIFATKMDDRVRITVNDNGIGIAPEYHERVFEVFKRLHTVDKYSGSGVGLAACRKMTLLLGGSIRLDSKLGEGATFHIDLPINMDYEASTPRLASSSALPIEEPITSHESESRES